MCVVGTEAQCVQTVKVARWLVGVVALRCNGTAHDTVGRGVGNLFQCNASRQQTSLFTSTELPLIIWFLATDLIGQAKTGVSSLVPMRHVGVSHPTT